MKDFRGDFQWRCSMEMLDGDVQSRCPMEMLNGDVQCRLELFNGCVQRKCSIEMFHGDYQLRFPMGRLNRDFQWRLSVEFSIWILISTSIDDVWTPGPICTGTPSLYSPEFDSFIVFSYSHQGVYQKKFRSYLVEISLGTTKYDENIK